MKSFSEQIRGLDLSPQSIATLQINITKQCNQACHHCHVDSTPLRTEKMSDQVIDKVLEILNSEKRIGILDITGGAPELHPRFKEVVEKATSTGKKVMVRHNLTITFDGIPGKNEPMLWLPQFFADHKVEVVSSLPYYQEFFTDKQRGTGVFKKSIEALKKLNAVGYGAPEKSLTLNLVYNPVGPFLPSSQVELEASYRKSLGEKFGIRFNNLFAITNMPIKRFKQDLEKRGQLEQYMDKLCTAFNPVAAAGIMCRNMVSVDYQGNLYDCDFNQMLDFKVKETNNSIFNFNYGQFIQRSIVFANHCYGCTAGSGSSCGGATA